MFADPTCRYWTNRAVSSSESTLARAAITRRPAFHTASGSSRTSRACPLTWRTRSSRYDNITSRISSMANTPSHAVRLTAKSPFMCSLGRTSDGDSIM